ncbi:MFS transporter [Xanthobacter dioxanivorans]|uniref:MFS transporter n=1 Tax=Xanthobacter dioxanivorans TaxID=2528964 RepID=A0A974SH24_9HYPH|nr:MFS transporter [Xanthobacter dioxanivorans]QRG05846.1 MFS transporter [Xanthobacter dioxanivorans]
MAPRPAAGNGAPELFSLRLRLGGAYATFYLALGIQMPYLPLWFQHQGLGPEAIGVALAVPMVMRLVATPVLGVLSDRLGRPKAMLVALALATVLGMAALAASRDPLLIFIVLGLMAMGWFPSFSLLDSYAARLARTGRADYGKARQWGSASFLVANLVGGAVASVLGAGSVVMLMLGCHLTYVAAALSLPELPRAEVRPHPVFGRRARLGLFAGIVASALVQASHAQLYAFASVHWQADGLSLTTIGALWAVGVAAEMVLFRFGTRFVMRFGPHALIAMGGLAAMVRFAAMATDPPLVVLFPLQLLHAFTFGATYLGMVELVARSVSEHRAGTGQTAAAWINSLVMAAANVASGPLWNAFGPLAFLASCGIALAGAGAAVVAARLQPHSSGSGG